MPEPRLASNGGVTTMILKQSDNSFRRGSFTEIATSYSLKSYFIFFLLSLSLYAVYHLHSTTQGLKADLAESIGNFQIQLLNFKSELSEKLHEQEMRYTSKMEELKEEIKTMTGEMSKLMRKITIKQMEEESSSESRRAVEEEGGEEPDYYSQLASVIASATENLSLGSTKSTTSEPEKINVFREIIRGLRANMRSQPRETWVEIYAGIVPTFSSSSPRPSTIVVLIPPHLQYTPFPTCFARRLANEVNRVFIGRKEVPLKELSSLGLSEASNLGLIHEDLKAYFDKEGGRGILVHSLEQIRSYEALMVFHAFCDNVEAYEKQATFIFTVNVPQGVYDQWDWTGINAKRIGHETLHEAWESVLTLDKRSALISRVAVNSILLRDGDSCL
jgi:hypothetical protein